jgi:hypothetical protein
MAENVKTDNFYMQRRVVWYMYIIFGELLCASIVKVDEQICPNHERTKLL